MKTVQEYKTVFENLKTRPRKSVAATKQVIDELVNLKTELEKDDKVDRAFRAAALILMEDFRRDTLEKFNPSDFVDSFCNGFSL